MHPRPAPYHIPEDVPSSTREPWFLVATKSRWDLTEPLTGPFPIAARMHTHGVWTRHRGRAPTSYRKPYMCGPGRGPRDTVVLSASLHSWEQDSPSFYFVSPVRPSVHTPESSAGALSHW